MPSTAAYPSSRGGLAVRLPLVISVVAAVVFGWIAYKTIAPARNRLGHVLVATGVSNPIWSSDSCSLYFADRSDGRIVRYDIQTGRRRVYSIPPDCVLVGVSPDQKSVLLVSHGERMERRILIRDLATGQEETVCRLSGGIGSVYWLRHGLISFQEKGAIYIVDEHGRHRQKVIPWARDYYGSSDGQVIVYRSALDGAYYVRNLHSRKDIMIPVPSGRSSVFMFQSARQVVFLTYLGHRKYSISSFAIGSKTVVPIWLPLQEYGGDIGYPPRISPDRTKFTYDSYIAVDAFNRPSRLYWTEVPVKTRQLPSTRN